MHEKEESKKPCLMKNNWQFLDGQNSHSQAAITWRSDHPHGLILRILQGCIPRWHYKSFVCAYREHTCIVLLVSDMGLTAEDTPTYLASTKQGSSDTFLWEKKTRGYFRPGWPTGSTQLPNLIHKLLIYRNFWILIAAKGQFWVLVLRALYLLKLFCTVSKVQNVPLYKANWK